MSHVVIWQEMVMGRGNGRCRGPEAGICHIDREAVLERSRERNRTGSQGGNGEEQVAAGFEGHWCLL